LVFAAKSVEMPRLVVCMRGFMLYLGLYSLFGVWVEALRLAHSRKLRLCDLNRLLQGGYDDENDGSNPILVFDESIPFRVGIFLYQIN
jgi:hypothetical protein